VSYDLFIKVLRRSADDCATKGALCRAQRKIRLPGEQTQRFKGFNNATPFRKYQEGEVKDGQAGQAPSLCDNDIR